MILTGWGRYPRIQAEGGYFEDVGDLAERIREIKECIIHALGRSYGDSALNTSVLLSSRFNNILEFDPKTGVVTCESGTSLSDLIDVFLPRGWFPAVTPGTRYITVGGAIASDVHGKNHHVAGCFSECLVSIDLMLSNGEIVRCSPAENRDIFLATCGGMGLTGIILTATLRLQKIPGAYVREKTIRAGNLEEIIDLFEAHHSETYSVAWIDCLKKGKNTGRSLLMLGEFENDGGLDRPATKAFSLPVDLPGFSLNRFSVSLFNEWYYRRIAGSESERVVHLESFFYPLDAVSHWNRMYGRNGFTQYQLVLPREAGYAGLRVILERITASGLNPFLGVLKLFGPENENYLSFPMEGYTLALDFKIEKRLFPLLDELDRILLDHGGRLYLAKDARMPRNVFRKGYRKWRALAELRERYDMKNKFNSLQSKRLGI